LIVTTSPANDLLTFGQRSQQRRFRQGDRRRFTRAYRPGDAGDAVEVCWVDNPLAAAGGMSVAVKCWSIKKGGG
jgi:hypothetical protein